MAEILPETPAQADITEEVEPIETTEPPVEHEEHEELEELPPTAITVSDFDNEISIRYKWATYFSYPSKYILVRPFEGDPADEPYTTRGLVYEPFAIVLTRLLNENLPLEEIYDIIHESNPEIVANDLAMFYYVDARTKGIDPEEILQTLNEFYEKYDKMLTSKKTEVPRGPQYPDLTRLQAVYEEWFGTFEKLRQKDVKALQKIQTIQDALSTLTPVRASPIVIDGVTVSVIPTLVSTGSLPSPSDGIDIFNQARPSLEVPYIQYNEDLLPLEGTIRNKYYKLYRGETADTAPKLNNVLPSSVKTNKPDRIYMTVWTDAVGDIASAKKDSYQGATYTIGGRPPRLLISSPVSITRDEKAALSYVADALPAVNLGPATEVKVRGEFFLYDFEITDYSLVDTVLNSELLSNYLYIEETIKSYASKKRINLRYKSLAGDVDETDKPPTGEGYITNKSSVSVKLKQLRVIPGGPPLIEQTPAGPVEITLPVGTPYVEVRITRADSREIASQFMEIFRRLMDYYRRFRSDLDRYYETYIPTLRIRAETPQKPIEKHGPGAPGRKHGERKIYKLQEMAPDIFVKQYARACQLPKQPVVVAPDEIDLWKNKKILVNDRLVDRQVMGFPPDNPKIWIACPDDANPYPGIKENKIMPNKEQYPYIPCCFGTNHMDPYIKPNSKYNQYLRGIRAVPTEAKPTKPGHKIKGEKILAPGRFGEVPTSIKDLLTRYSEDVISIGRWGVPTGVNSFIHCVLEALEIPDYINLNVEDKEAYAVQVRRVLHDTIDPSLYQQELYDYSLEEIRLQIANPDLFLDPHLYYRGLEEMFNVNIYSFVPTEEQPSEEETREVSGFMEIPRFKVFHAQPYREDRHSIIVYKHRGGKSALSGESPQCELIVDYDEDTKTAIKSFGGDMTDLLYSTMIGISKTITTTIETPPDAVTDLAVRANVYSTVDFYEVIKRSATGQILDGYGKLRAFVFPTTHGTMSMVFPPGQPENLPLVQDLVRANIDDVIAIFGDPLGVTLNESGLVDGFWYRAMDIMFGVYVPLIPTDRALDLPIGPSNPIPTQGTNVVDRVKRLQRTLSILLQLVKWLYVVAQVSAPVNPRGERPPVLATEFDQRYLSVSNRVVADSSTFYDFSAVPRKLPIAETVDDGIRLGEQFAPTLFAGGKIIMYNESFRKKVVDALREYYILMSPLPLGIPGSPLEVGADWVIPTEIDGLYLDAEDFQTQPYVLVFVGERDLDSWLKSMNLPSFTNITIKTKLDISLGNLDEPYMYLAPDKKIYLIQNVRDGSFDRALTVSLYWTQHRINMGTQAELYVGDTPVHVVYGISASGTPVIGEGDDHSNKSPIYLQLLRYGTFNMKTPERQPDGTIVVKEEIKMIVAAMLPLL